MSMNLTPTELERLTIFSAAEFARRNRTQGIRLSHAAAKGVSIEVLSTGDRGA
jgi:urease subunit gamma/beta